MSIRSLLVSLVLILAFAGRALAIDFPYRSFEQMYGQRAAGVVNFDFNQGHFAFKAPFDGGGGFPFTIYSTHSGSLQVVATDGTPLPYPDPGFDQAQLTNAGTPSLDGQNVVFRGGAWPFTGNVDAMYRNTNDSWGVIGDWNTPLPWGALPDTFGEPVARGGAVAFATSSEQGPGIAIERDGTVELLVSALPGGISFAYPDARIAFDGEHAAFAGYSSVNVPTGVYRDDSGQTLTIADINTSIPGGTGGFTSFGLPAIDNGRVAFVGYGEDDQSGIYSDWTGTLETVVDIHSPVPGGGEFLRFYGDEDYAPGFDNGRVAFVARILDADQEEKFALFTNATGTLTRILTEGDQLGANAYVDFIASWPGFSHVRLSGNEIAFNTFDTGVGGSINDIYVVTVPEPSALALSACGLGAVALFGAARRRRFRLDVSLAQRIEGA